MLNARQLLRVVEEHCSPRLVVRVEGEGGAAIGFYPVSRFGPAKPYDGTLLLEVRAEDLHKTTNNDVVIKFSKSKTWAGMHIRAEVNGKENEWAYEILKTALEKIRRRSIRRGNVDTIGYSIKLLSASVSQEELSKRYEELFRGDCVEDNQNEPEGATSIQS